MTRIKADLILHPVRMRVLLALAGRHMSAQQLARVLPDIPQATLYRHINVLAHGGVLVVVEKRLVHGATESVYSVGDQAGRLTKDDARSMDRDDHLRAFTTFVTSLLSDFSRYLDHTALPDPGADGVRYSKGALYLTDDELATLTGQLQALLAPFAAPRPEIDHTRRVFALVLLPDPDQGSSDRDRA